MFFNAEAWLFQHVQSVVQTVQIIYNVISVYQILTKKDHTHHAVFMPKFLFMQYTPVLSVSQHIEKVYSSIRKTETVIEEQQYYCLVLTYRLI